MSQPQLLSDDDMVLVRAQLPAQQSGAPSPRWRKFRRRYEANPVSRLIKFSLFVTVVVSCCYMLTSIPMPSKADTLPTVVSTCRQNLMCPLLMPLLPTSVPNAALELQHGAGDLVTDSELAPLANWRSGNLFVARQASCAARSGGRWGVAGAEPGH